jgi:hypothetical protein
VTSYVITNGTHFLAWDNKGAMATGYPMWVTIDRAMLYETVISAKKAGASLRRSLGQTIFVQAVWFSLGDKIEITLPEDDPEYAEFQRLKKKFGEN